MKSFRPNEVKLIYPTVKQAEQVRLVSPYEAFEFALQFYDEDTIQHHITTKVIVIVKTCSDSLFSIGQKNCQLFVAKLRNFLDSHNRMVLY